MGAEAPPRRKSGAVLGRETLHDCLKVLIRTRTGEEALANEEG